MVFCVRISCGDRSDHRTSIWLIGSVGWLSLRRELQNYTKSLRRSFSATCMAIRIRVQLHVCSPSHRSEEPDPQFETTLITSLTVYNTSFKKSISKAAEKIMKVEEIDITVTKNNYLEILGKNWRNRSLVTNPSIILSRQVWEWAGSSTAAQVQSTFAGHI